MNSDMLPPPEIVEALQELHETGKLNLQTGTAAIDAAVEALGLEKSPKPE